ncbi:hypothetical protein QQ045_022642 [Rhodiola kirilowii]
MQTHKSKATPIEVPSRTSPKTPRTARQIKTPGSGTEPVSSSPNKANRANKDHSPKIIERKTTQSPISEKKRQSKSPDLESQIIQLQEDLKQAKDKMISSELLKEQAELEAEEAKKQLSTMTTKMEETEKQLMEISDVEKSRVQELCKITQDHDSEWESELDDSAQKQHAWGSAEASSALDETHTLKKQLDVEAQSDAGPEQFSPAGSAHDTFHSLRSEHEKTVATVEKLEVELSDCKKSEASALEKLNNTKSQLEAAIEENKSLKLGNFDTLKDFNTVASELEESKAKVKALETLVINLQSEAIISSDGENGTVEGSAADYQENGESRGIEQLNLEIMNLKYEDCKLRAALEAAEMRYHELRLQNTLDIRSAYEQVESAQLDSKSKVAELEAELRKANSDIKELQAELVDRETRLQTYAEKELMSDAEIEQRRQLEFQFTALQETLLKKENLLQAIEKENEILKREVRKWQMEKIKATDGSDADTVAEARAAEQKAVSKFEYLTEESDKNSKRTARVIEQLDAAQAANAELESELRKLKVQSDQWRKAAEAAAAMLTSGNNGKYIDRTGSLDSSYHTLGGRIGSPFSDDLNDESAKKKNGNMLKKIGVLWKKGQNQK